MELSLIKVITKNYIYIYIKQTKFFFLKTNHFYG
jgi:hypothetical protein